MDKVRQSIIDSASFLFASYGYDKTTVEDISRRANKAKASIYYYYDGKASIMKDVLAREVNSLISSLEAAVRRYPDDSPDRLVLYMKARMELLGEMKVYKRHVMTKYHDSETGVGEMVKEAREVFDRWEYDYFYKLCEFCRETGVFSDAVKPPVFARMLIMLLQGVEVQFFMADDMEATRSTYEAILELLVYSVYNNSQK